MKRLLAAALLAISPAAMAASQFDGVYQCFTNIPAISKTLAAMAVFMSKDSGEAGTAVLCPVAPCSVYGYSTGHLNGTTYTGSDEHGDAVTATISASGIFRVTGTSTYDGVPYPSTSTCAKFW